MTRIVFDRVGGPEVLRVEPSQPQPPARGEVTLRHHAVGINYIDTYHRSGLYPVALPSGLGLEAAGVITAVGDGVSGLAVGDRVATFMGPIGAYADARTTDAAPLVPIPNDMDFETAAALLLKGCTAEFLIERCARVEAGESVLVHAAAGGVGLLLVQWLNALGARVIGTVSSEPKAALARAAGCDHVLLLDREAVAPQVRALTDGRGVRVVFDGVGRALWTASLDSLCPRGLLVSFGNASGPVTGVDLGILAQKGSLFVTRPTLFNYYTSPEDRAAGVARVVDLWRSGQLGVTIGQRWPLAEAAEAHRALEARATTGSSLLTP